ncbi:hypothetical protein FO440_11625 [Mucilaginibacter corticis]|uniref:Uncharacterized protein n=1 Tax=Mucilaginibacter corticis TaxID=2597670 RepID=A0A556MKF7_9SPHI|nr:hypothetical protein [Mucilaginibacter corticis]TSJ40401.1 hypothetical protein FO440_11625 [Mucilaginibacter corticis]
MQSNQTSSQFDRFICTGHTPGPANWRAFTLFFEFGTNTKLLVTTGTSDEKLRVKAGKTSWAVRQQGHW